MTDRLDSRIRAFVVELVDDPPAAPPFPPSDVVVSRGDRSHRRRAMETTSTGTEQRTPWWRGPRVAVGVVAATVAVIFAGFAILTMFDSDEPFGAGSTDVEVATGFWEALAAGDREATLGLVDPNALESPTLSPFGRAQTLEGQFDWYETNSWEWKLEECVEGDSGEVECVATARNAWSDALGVEPVTGTFLVRFGENGITEVADKADSFFSQWSPMVFSFFADWVATNHPADADVMFDFSVEVNPEILNLYQLNTSRFVEAQQTG